MRMLPHLLAAASLAAAIAVAPTATSAPDPCARTSFQTGLIKHACTTNGRMGALNAMSGFVSTANDVTGDNISCNSCHARVGGDFPLEPGALGKFRHYAAQIRASK